MADLAARREARMRRILENSENRLNRITGVENKTVSQDVLPASPRNSIHGDCAKPETSNNPRRALDLDISPNNVTNIENIDLPNILTQLNPALLLPPTTPALDRNQQVSGDTRSEHKRFLVICLIAVASSVVGTVLDKIVSGSVSNLQLNSVFGPLFIYEIYEFVFLHRQPKVSTVMSYVLLFLESRTGRKYGDVVKILVKISDILHDVLVYFFIYVVCSLFINLML